MFIKLPPDVIHAMITLVFLTVGAIAHANTHLQSSRKRGEHMTKSDYIVFLTYGALGGLIFSQIASFYFENQYIIRAATGIGAFLGFKGLVFGGELIMGVLTAAVKKYDGNDKSQ